MKNVIVNKHIQKLSWVLVKSNLILLLYIVFFVNIGTNSGTTNRSTIIIETGSFSMTNTSEKYTLLNDIIYSMAIGTTWNLTIVIHGNSSSRVSFSFNSIDGIPLDYWEGTKNFVVSSNETRSEQYVSHCVADESPGFNFQYTLVDSTKNASGMYKFEKIHPGYSVNVGTGHLYVPNITAWLFTRSSLVTSSISILKTTLNTTVTSSNLSTSDSTNSLSTSLSRGWPFIVLLTSVLSIVYRRKMKS